MALNPDTNKFESVEKPTIAQLEKLIDGKVDFEVMPNGVLLIRPDGSPVPKHWSVFKVGKDYVIENYTFRCVYIGETNILFEPVSPVIESPSRKIEQPEGGEA